MMALLSILVTGTLFGGSFLVQHQASKRRAQFVAIMVAGAALLITLVSAATLSLPEREVANWLTSGRHVLVAASCNGIIGLIAVALSPLSSHNQRAFATILRLIAVGHLFLTLQHPVALASCWALSAFITWQELASSHNTKSVARIFSFYQLPSAVLFGLGIFLLFTEQQSYAIIPLILAIFAREAVLPFFGWFIRFVQYAPLGVVVAFVSPQLGVYAHLELLQTIMPREMAHLFAGVVAVSAFFAAFLAFGQTKARRVAAYMVMSQTGTVAFGLENSDKIGWSGAVVMWFVMSLGVAGFLLTLAKLEARRGELILGQSAGDPAQTPRLAASTLLLGLATVGSPLTLGFVAEDLVVQGSLDEHPILGLGLIVITAMNGITVLRIYFGLYTAGKHRAGESDINKRELIFNSIVIGLLVLSGIFPGPVVAFIQ